MPNSKTLTWASIGRQDVLYKYFLNLFQVVKVHPPRSTDVRTQVLRLAACQSISLDGLHTKPNMLSEWLTEHFLKLMTLTPWIIFYEKSTTIENVTIAQLFFREVPCTTYCLFHKQRIFYNKALWTYILLINMLTSRV